MTTNQFALAFLLTLALTSVNAGTVEPYNATEVNPMCAKPGVLSHEATDMTTNGGSVLEFDWTSSYYTNIGDSAPIMVRKGAGAVGYKFITWDDNFFTTLQEAECTGTGALQFVKLISGILVLKSGSDYKICVLNLADPTAAVTPIVLTLPDQDVITDPFVNILPFSYSESRLFYFIFSDNTDSAIYSYDTSGSSPLSPTLVGTKFAGNALTEVHGNHEFIYNHVDSKIYATTDWTENTVVAPFDGGVVTSHRFRGSVVALALYNADKTQIKLAKVTINGITDWSFTKTSTTPHIEYDDDVTNYLVYGSDFMFWASMTESSNTINTVTITKSDLTGLQIDVSTIEHIALSGNKAVIYHDSKLMYWKLQQQDYVKVVYSTASTGMTTAGDYEYKLSLSCMCKALRKFICYSSTLSCIIIKKGTDSCFTIDGIIVD